MYQYVLVHTTYWYIPACTLPCIPAWDHTNIYWYIPVRTRYPYRFSHGDTTVFSRRFNSSLFIPPIRNSVLGRTYGTYLLYERSYAINVFFIRSFGELGLRFDLPAKASVFSHRSPCNITAISCNRREISRRFCTIAVKFHGDFVQLP